MDLGLGGRSVVVTGGSSGIGLATAKLLGRAGAADEVASAIAYLLSPRAGFATGAVLDITGGHRST